MSDIVAFLHARLAKDEQVARAAIAPDWQISPNDRHHVQVVPAHDATGPSSIIAYAVGGEAWHIARHDPARVLRDVEAKREAIRLYEDTLATIEMLNSHGNEALGHKIAAESYLNVIRREAAVYADHPDYRAEWAR